MKIDCDGDEKNDIYDQILKFEIKYNRLFCKIIKIVKIGARSTSSLGRHRRDLSFWQYWLKGGSWTPDALNSEIGKLKSIEEADINDVRDMMFTRKEAGLLIEDVTGLHKSLTENLCRLQESIGKLAVTSTLQNKLRETMQRLKEDVSNCDRQTVPPGIKNSVLFKICLSLNPKSKLCLDPSRVRSIFSCRIKEYNADVKSLERIHIKYELSLLRLSSSARNAFYINTIPVPLSRDKFDTRRRFPTAKPKTTTDINSKFKSVFQEFINSRNKRSLEDFSFQRLENVPQILVQSYKGAITSLSDCITFRDKSVLCDFRAKSRTDVMGKECITHLFKNDVIRTENSCRVTRFRGNHCIVKPTYNGVFLLSTFEDIPILINDDSDLFESAQDRTCKSKSVCVIHKPQRTFRCGNTYTTQRLMTEITIKKITPKTPPILSNFQSIDKNTELVRKLDFLRNQTSKKGTEIDEIRNHHILSKIMQIEEGTVTKIRDKSKLGLIIVMTILVTSCFIIVVIKFRKYIITYRTFRKGTFESKTLIDLVRKRNEENK